MIELTSCSIHIGVMILENDVIFLNDFDGVLVALEAYSSVMISGVRVPFDNHVNFNPLFPGGYLFF
jgi:hypothetical protein